MKERKKFAREFPMLKIQRSSLTFEMKCSISISDSTLNRNISLILQQTSVETLHFHPLWIYQDVKYDAHCSCRDSSNGPKRVETNWNARDLTTLKIKCLQTVRMRPMELSWLQLIHYIMWRHFDFVRDFYQVWVVDFFWRMFSAATKWKFLKNDRDTCALSKART